MMFELIRRAMVCSMPLVLGVVAPAQAASDAPPPPPPPSFDPALARAVGADVHGMRNYVFVVLKTGPNKMPAGPERDAMFNGHFANMKRLSAEGKLVLAGPFDGVDGWRGLFILAVTEIDDAKKLVATDPVIVHGEMIAEYHSYYGTAALMQLPEAHAKVAKEPF